MTYHQTKLCEERKKKILDFLTFRGMTASDVTTATNFSASSVRKLIAEMHDEGQIYVEAWVKSRTSTAARWRAGSEPDAELIEGAMPTRHKAFEIQPPEVVIARHWLDVAFFGEYRRAA